MVHEVPLSAGVVLDLDDTLYPERSFHVSGFRAVARRGGLDPDGPEVGAACRALRSGGRPLDILSAATGIGVDTIIGWHREHQPDISLYTDAKRFLARLHAAAIPIVILTDGRSMTQRHKIVALGIQHQVQAVLISEETGMDKAHADAYRHAAAQMPGHTPLTYFGDNPVKDVQHPASMGWQVFLMLDRGDNVHPQSIDNAVLRSVHTLSTFDDVEVATRS